MDFEFLQRRHLVGLPSLYQVVQGGLNSTIDCCLMVIYFVKSLFLCIYLLQSI